MILDFARGSEWPYTIETTMGSYHPPQLVLDAFVEPLCLVVFTL